MKIQFLIFAILLGSLFCANAQITGDDSVGGNECPERCRSTSQFVCCKTPGGSTYYGDVF